MTQAKKTTHNHKTVKPFKVNIVPFNPDGYASESEVKKTI